MAIVIDKPEKDLHLSQDEYNRLLDEYERAYMFYSGTPPTFETWAARKQAERSNAEITGGLTAKGETK